MMHRTLAVLAALTMLLACGHGPTQTIEEGQTQSAARGHGSTGDPTKPPEVEDAGEVENEDAEAPEVEDGGVEVENEDGGHHRH